MNLKNKIMEKRVLNGFIGIVMLVICYYYGYVEQAAYDNQWNYKDLISIVTGLLWMVYTYRASVND